MFYFRVQSWCTQRVASLSLVLLLCVLYFALWHSSPPHAPNRYNTESPIGQQQYGLTASQLILVCWTSFVHFLALVFPVRLCWGTWSLTRKLRKVPERIPTSPKQQPTDYEEKVGGYEVRAEGKYRLSDAFSIEMEAEAKAQLVLHAIIIPNYKEDLDTLRETLDVLACHPQASSSYDVYLAMEQDESGSEAKAQTLIKEYKARFQTIESTMHPRGIPGEAQGKSSNLSWAAKYIINKYQREDAKRNVIVTVLDADSHLLTNYFHSVTSMHLAYPDTAETIIYVPPIVFDRNAHTVPIIVRVADIFWGGAGLSGHLWWDPIRPPTSVYSLPLSLIERVGGWDAGDDAIGEDLHMYVKCFFTLNGNLTVRTVLSAASQSNVHSDAKGIRGYFLNCNARYRQALRHMWGSLDSGYVVKSSSEMLWKKNGNSPRPHWLNTILLYHRMFEAHFLPAHLALLIISTTIYTILTPASRVPTLLQQILDTTAYTRIISLSLFTLFIFLYEHYHYHCLKVREDSMISAGLADKMLNSFSYRNWRQNWKDYCVFPLTGVAFGSAPALVALTCHFWTTKLVYRVSKKPARMAVV